MGGGRDQNLATHVTALLLRGQLVLEVDAGGAGLDERLHDLETVERAAKAGFRVGDNGQEPVPSGAAFGVLDLVGALQGAVYLAAKLRRRVGGVQALVRVHRACGVVVRGHLPAGEIDRLKSRPRHLHGLIAGHRAQGVDERFLVEQFPQSVGAAFGQGVDDLHRPPQPFHVLRRIGAFDVIETALRRARNKLAKTTHVRLLASCSAESGEPTPH